MKTRLSGFQMVTVVVEKMNLKSKCEMVADKNIKNENGKTLNKTSQSGQFFSWTPFHAMCGRQAGRQAVLNTSGLPLEQVCLPELARLPFRFLLLFNLECCCCC
jgi:hypothetical protein